MEEVELTKRVKQNRRRQQRANEEVEEEVVIPEVPMNEDNDKNEIIREASETNPPNKPKRRNKTRAPPKSRKQSKPLLYPFGCSFLILVPNNAPNVCLICMEEFPSKNKLFSHIKMTGHAALKTAPQTLSKKNKNKR